MGTWDSDSPNADMATRYKGPSFNTTNVCVRVEKLLIISKRLCQSILEHVAIVFEKADYGLYDTHIPRDQTIFPIS
jgi:hypothetical protein